LYHPVPGKGSGLRKGDGNTFHCRVKQ
jgi:hypothetical protein